MAITTTNIIAITGVIQAIICSIIFLAGVVALIRGGWKALKEFFIASKKINLFIDKMMPGILEHLSSSQRIPRDTLSKWTAIISDGSNFKSSSPLDITENGYRLIKKVKLDEIFDKNKKEWARMVDQKIANKPASKYTIENECINFASSIFDNNSAFNSIQNYLYDNPQENKYDFVVMAGLLLRNYYFEKYPNNVFSEK
ncbi:MAG: hypothetical protein V1770_03275 [bacterium]